MVLLDNMKKKFLFPGSLFLALYFKQCRVCLQRTVGEDTTPFDLSVSVSLTRGRLPRGKLSSKGIPVSTRKAKPDQFTKKVTAFNQRGSLRSNLVNLEIEIERGPVTSILEEESLFPKEDS